MSTPQDDAVPTETTPTTTGDSDRSRAEEPAEGEGDTGADVPREHSEDPAEG